MVEKEKKYRFIISRNKNYKKKYNVTKKDPTPLDKLRELFVYEREGGEDKPQAKVQKKNNLLKTLGMVLVAFVLVFGGLLFFIFSGLDTGVPVSPISERDMNININAIETGLANLGGHNVYTPYISFNAETSKLHEVEYFIEATNGPLYNTVYLLNSRREQGTRYDEFKEELRKNLAIDGIKVNEIDLESLRNIPDKTSAFLIVPTGYMPVQLAHPDRSFRKLAESGIHIIYIGYDFSSGLVDEEKGRIFPEEYSVDAISSNLNIRAAAGGGVSGLNLRSSGIRYTVINRDESVVSDTYGSIPLIKWSGDGTLIVLPESLDSGWNTGKAAADDVTKIIRDEFQLKGFGRYIQLTTPVRKRIGTNTTINDIIITDGKANIAEAYVRLVVRGYTYNAQGNRVFEIAETYYFHEQKEIKGTLLNNRYALSRDLSGSMSDLTANLNEERARFPSPIPIFLKVYSSKGEIVSQESFGTSYILPVDYTFTTQFNPRMSPGTYVLKLEDSSQVPYVFAKSIMQVPAVRLRVFGEHDWRENIFRFTVTTDELGSANQYTRSLEGTRVIINDEIVKTVRVYRMGNDYFAEVRVPEGLEENKEHVFVFEAQEGLVYRGTSTITRQYYEELWFWLALILAIVPVGIGILLRTKEKPLYSIDIPEFEVKKVNKIKIKKDIFINLFDSINKDYNWNYMPLKLKEIKNGFRKITYMGRPVIIGDYNLSVILEKLKNDGEVKNHLDLYVLTKWEEESGHDYKYLAMFRKVRDKFLNLAIPFSNINERKDCDIYVKSYRGEFKFVLGEGNNLYERIYRSLGSKEKVILVFKDEEDKMKFNENITMMGGGEGIKITIIDGKLKRITINDIKRIVK